MSQETIKSILSEIKNKPYVTVEETVNYARKIRSLSGQKLDRRNAMRLVFESLGIIHENPSVKETSIVLNKSYKPNVDFSDPSKALLQIRQLGDNDPIKKIVVGLVDNKGASRTTLSNYAKRIRDLSDSECRLGKAYAIIAIALGYSSWGELISKTESVGVQHQHQ